MANQWMRSLILFVQLTAAQLKRAENTYDYIVIGCGISGLVVSNRLSELRNSTVLCLEAGDLDNGEDQITIPYYIGRQPAGFYDWQFTTAPQTQLDNQTRSLPLGKGVGGGSLINGMVWNRGSQESFNAWADIGNPGWAWQNLLPYFQMSENFSASSYPNQSVVPSRPDANLHGAYGPVFVTYPSYYWKQSDNWFRALESLGIPSASNPNEGLSAGGYFLPLSLNPMTQTRHDARRAYLNPARNRVNLFLQTAAQVTKIIFDSNATLRAVGVQYIQGHGEGRQQQRRAYARKEILLAAGAINTPKILELSGIGPIDILQRHNITVLKALPGVGNNLQDHAMIHLDYPYTQPNLTSTRTFDQNTTFNEQCANEYHTSRTGPWTATPSEAVAFLSLDQFVPDSDSLINRTTTDITHFDTNADQTLRLGYAEQVQKIIHGMRIHKIPTIEILNNNAGGLDLALQSPLSRGSSHISSSNPNDQPLINPNWLAHQLDFQIMLEAIQFNQRLLETPALQELQPTFRDVPANATLAFLEEILMARVGTEYHSSGTAAMLPLHLGGVVDASLVVYGTDNLRVVDTSVFPIIPAAHLQAVTYAVAEKAADLVKGVVSGPARV